MPCAVEGLQDLAGGSLNCSRLANRFQYILSDVVRMPVLRLNR